MFLFSLFFQVSIVPLSFTESKSYQVDSTDITLNIMKVREELDGWLSVRIMRLSGDIMPRYWQHLRSAATKSHACENCLLIVTGPYMLLEHKTPFTHPDYHGLDLYYLNIRTIVILFVCFGLGVFYTFNCTLLFNQILEN